MSMTENKIKPTMEQTIYCLKAESEKYPEVCEECQLYGEVGCDHCYDDTNDMAIKFLKELERYKAISTVEGYENAIKAYTETYILMKEYKSKLQDFEAIGTVEEFKALKEKI